MHVDVADSYSATKKLKNGGGVQTVMGTYYLTALLSLMMLLKISYGNGKDKNTRHEHHD